MDTSQSFEIRVVRVDEFGRVSELIRDLQTYQEMKYCPRIPTKEELEKELTHEDEKTNVVMPNRFGAITIVAVDLTRLDEPNHAYIVGYMIYSHNFSIVYGRLLYMNSFFIDENYRRKGLGRKFMEYLRLQGLVLGTNKLDVPYMNNNYKGQSFYANYGNYSCNQDYELMLKVVN